jgi:hypothetical protein
MKGERIMKAAGILACLGIVTALVFAGCSEETGPCNPGHDSGIDWPDLTAREDVIDYLLLTYEHRDYDRYNTLLHPDYIWYFQPRDAEELGTPLIDYAEDAEATKRIFDRAVMLELELGAGTWNEITEVGGQPCHGCWETDRVYGIQVQFTGGDVIYTGSDMVKFIIVPVDDGGATIFKIKWAYDIDFF